MMFWCTVLWLVEATPAPPNPWPRRVHHAPGTVHYAPGTQFNCAPVLCTSSTVHHGMHQGPCTTPPAHLPQGGVEEVWEVGEALLAPLLQGTGVGGWMTGGR